MLSDKWRQRLAHYDQWFVGLSGGLDSTVLLHVLSGLPDAEQKLTAVHLNHGLSQHAAAWSAHCAQFCAALSIKLIVENLYFDAASNIEEHARTARYAVLATLLNTNSVCCVAHHADDQAETVILQLMRGAGVQGLAAMTEEKPLGLGTLARPFLQHSRQALMDYAHLHQLTWIEDESNQDLNFSRNYVRHTVLPVLLNKWPQAVARLNITAEHCQQASRHLKVLADQDIDQLTLRTLNLAPLLSLSLDRLQNALRQWLENNHIRVHSTRWFQCLIRELVFAAEHAQPCLRTGQWLIRRYRSVLYLLENHIERSYSACMWTNFPEPLNLTPDGPCIYALPGTVGVHVPAGSIMQVRFRSGGEKVRWYGQAQALKTLFQEWGVLPWERDITPLIYRDECLVAVAGIASDTRKGSTSGEIFNIHMNELPAGEII